MQWVGMTMIWLVDGDSQWYCVLSCSFSECHNVINILVLYVLCDSA